MNCVICKDETLSGRFIFVGEQKRIICPKCQDEIEERIIHGETKYDANGNPIEPIGIICASNTKK